jgi:sulfite reductase (NADPH) hemoprotein beta-component
MAAVDDVRTLGRTRLSFASEADIDEFVEVLGRFERGEITPDQWRAFRLVRGTYGQRQPDVQMLRVKVPQGVLDAAQLEALADVSERYSRGFGHITTRQNIQFHFVKLPDVEAAMRQLADTGLTTREACGNSVRNITACPYAGVAADEVFDVTPYAEALTRYLLRHPLSSSLPRKFKISFEGCSTDHSVTSINDIGFRARIRTTTGYPERGFQVRVGGSTSIFCRSGELLYDFLPAAEMFNVPEAILRVYHRLGDYKHKSRNRMKFLIAQMGWENWRREYDEALESFRAEGGAEVAFNVHMPSVEGPPSGPRLAPPSVEAIVARTESAAVVGPGLVPQSRPLTPSDAVYERWLETNVRRQKQLGYSIVTASLPLGDFTGTQMRLLGQLALAFGDGTVRVSTEQDVVFRWIRHEDVCELYRRLAAAGMGLAEANTIADVTSCPGAESCRLAVTQSRGLGRLLEDHLREHPELIAQAPDAKIKISGCPNGCGQHHIATLGFQGSVRRLGSRVVPQYFVMVGGGVDDNGADFARLAAKIPARRATEAIDRLIAFYTRKRRPGETSASFFQRVSVAEVKAEIGDLERLTPEDAVPSDFIDLGEDTEFVPEVMDGECSA